MDRVIKRGDIFYADLSPVIGSEQGGVRPFLILQNNIGNRFSPTVIGAAITSKTKKALQPTHKPVICRELEKESIVLLEQIRTIDKERLGNYIGCVSGKNLAFIDAALKSSLGLKDRREDHK